MALGLEDSTSPYGGWIMEVLIIGQNLSHGTHKFVMDLKEVDNGFQYQENSSTFCFAIGGFLSPCFFFQW